MGLIVPGTCRAPATRRPTGPGQASLSPFQHTATVSAGRIGRCVSGRGGDGQAVEGGAVADAVRRAASGAPRAAGPLSARLGVRSRWMVARSGRPWPRRYSSRPPSSPGAERLR